MSLPLQSWVTGKGPQTQFHLSDDPPDVVVRDSSGHTFYLHKSILIRHSKFFKTRFDPQRPSSAVWSSPSDPSTGAPIITLPNEFPDFTHAELNRLFHFMYMGAYSTGNRNTSTVETKLIAHSRCFALADRLDVPELKALAVHNFRALTANEKGDQPSTELAKWPPVIESVFTLTIVTDLELRNVVVDVLSRYDPETLMAHDPIQEMVEERFHDLAVHMYHLMVAKWADKCKDELRLKEFFVAKEAFSTEAEDEIIAEAKKSEGW